MYWYKKGFYNEKACEEAKELSITQYNEMMEKIGSGGQLKEDSFGMPYVELTAEQENNVDNLRIKREMECFPIINRGQAWYKKLTAVQEAELDLWYSRWLNVTETKQIPQKPSWIK